MVPSPSDPPRIHAIPQRTRNRPDTPPSPPPLPHAAASFSESGYPEALFPHQPQSGAVRGKTRTGSEHRGRALSSSLLSPAVVRIQAWYSLGLCHSGKQLEAPAGAGQVRFFLRSPCCIFCFTLAYSQRGCCSQSSSETGSNRPEPDLVAVETEFLPLCEGGSGLVCSSVPCLPASQPPTAVRPSPSSPACLFSLALPWAKAP